MVVTSGPRRIVLVWAASAAKSVQPSNHASVGAYGSTKWSQSQTLSKPSSSNHCHCATSRGQGRLGRVMTPNRIACSTIAPPLHHLMPTGWGRIMRMAEQAVKRHVVGRLTGRSIPGDRVSFWQRGAEEG